MDDEPKKEYFVQVLDPSTPENDWRGQLLINTGTGHVLRITCSPERVQNINDPIQLETKPFLLAKSSQNKYLLLYGHEQTERQTTLDSVGISFRLTIKIETVIFCLSEPKMGLDAICRSFSIKSPIVFAFLSPKPYDLKVGKRNKKVTIVDKSPKNTIFSGKIFEKIEIDIEKSFGHTSAHDNVGIQYSASLWLKPNKPFTLQQTVVISQFVEKFLFFLVGDNCGSSIISIHGKTRRTKLFTAHPSSALYVKKKPPLGIERVWTIPKTKVDFGTLIDKAMANAKAIEKPLELVLDAQMTKDSQSRFFKRVRCMEAIGRDILPRGIEELPPQLADIQKLLAESDEKLEKFFISRCRPIFEKKNGLGYAVEFMKKVFPFASIVEVDKRMLVRLRNLEAHAAAHNFTPDEVNYIDFYSAVLDFATRGLILKFLGLSHDEIISGIPNGKFSWFIGRIPSQ